MCRNKGNGLLQLKMERAGLKAKTKPTEEWAKLSP